MVPARHLADASRCVATSQSVELKRPLFRATAWICLLRMCRSRQDIPTRSSLVRSIQPDAVWVIVYYNCGCTLPSPSSVLSPTKQPIPAGVRAQPSTPHHFHPSFLLTSKAAKSTQCIRMPAWHHPPCLCEPPSVPTAHQHTGLTPAFSILVLALMCHAPTYLHNNCLPRHSVLPNTLGGWSAATTQGSMTAKLQSSGTPKPNAPERSTHSTAHKQQASSM